MSLLHSLCHDTQSRSAVQLSLSSLYPYHYSCIGKSIDGLKLYKDKDNKEVALTIAEAEKVLQEQLYKELLPGSPSSPYWLVNTDVTPVYREHSRCLSDRNFVKKNNVIKRKNGTVIGIGYEVSTVGLNLRGENRGIGWNPPLSMRRVGSCENSVLVGVEQIKEVLSSALFAENTQIIVNTLDSGYFSLNYICEIGESVIDYDKGEQVSTTEDEQEEQSNDRNLVSIIRVPSNRVVYRQVAYDAAYNQEAGKSGAKLKFGDKFKLNEQETHWKEDSTLTFDWTSHGGKPYQVVVDCWEDMIIRGKNDRPTYDKPFRLVRIQLVNAKTGEIIFKRPMWLAVLGKRRKELSLDQVHACYAGRFDIEHFFSFGKKKLLLNSYQTCEVDHFDNWLLLGQLSYWMLYAARSLGENQYHPWEKYQQSKAAKSESSQAEDMPILTPIQTKRSFDRIIQGFENKPPIPKSRNNTSGRKKGDSPGKRQRHQVLKKAQYRSQQAAQSP